MAANAIRNTNANSLSASGSMQKLSSGLAITTAADDAAGLAISEKMKAQIRGLETASDNAQDGVSMVQTADGALSETTSILQRMRELANQAANDTNTAQDRSAIQTETNALIEQLNNIGDTTEFNTKKLLDGGAGVKLTATNGNVSNLAGTADTSAGAVALTGTNTLAAVATKTGGAATIGGLATTATVLGGAGATIGIAGNNYSFTAANTVQNVLDTINADSASSGVTATWANGVGITLTSTSAGSNAKVDITAAGTGLLLDAGSLTVGVTSGTDASFAGASLTNLGGSYEASGNHVTVTSGNYKGLSFDISSTGATTINIASNNSMKLQIGANSAQTMSISINDMRASALGVSGLNMTSAAGAKDAITAIDNALNRVSTERAKLGAYQNRLESTINNLGTTSENLTSAQSSVTDVDMASEMAEFSKNNVLSQAAQAMLSQANQQPQQVLQLLK
jgi:flagellin